MVPKISNETNISQCYTAKQNKQKKIMSTHPYNGPSFPIADTIMTLLAVSSQT